MRSTGADTLPSWTLIIWTDTLFLISRGETPLIDLGEPLGDLDFLGEDLDNLDSLTVSASASSTSVSSSYLFKKYAG